MSNYVNEMPLWMAVALGELGQAEIPGDSNNPRILEYHATTTLKATADFVPWCSSFLCWVMECANIDSPRSARARDWLTWGHPLTSPKFGSVVVMARGTSASMGHVGFIIDHDPSRIYVLGGNQGDRVSVRSFLKTLVLSYRWPIKV